MKRTFRAAVFAAGFVCLGKCVPVMSHEIGAVPNETPKLRNPVDITISPDGRRAVVVCHNNSIAVINLESGNYEIRNLGPNVWPGRHPLKAAFIDGRCFVINEYSDFITEFDPFTLQIVANHRVPMYCQDLLYDEAAGVIYVTNRWLDEVLVYNKSFQAIKPNIRVGRNPKPLALSDDRQRLYVGNLGSWNVSVIDVNANAVAENIYLGSAPAALAAMPQYILAANHGGKNLKTINGAPLIENDQDDIANIVTFIDQRNGALADNFKDAGADYADLRVKDGLMIFTGAGTGSVHIYRLGQLANTLQTIDILADEWGLPAGRVASGLRVYTHTRIAAIKDSETIYAANYFRDSVVEIKFSAGQNRFVVAREIPINAAGVVVVPFRGLGTVSMNSRQNGERYFSTIAGWARGQKDFTCATCHPNGHSDFRFIFDKKADPHNPDAAQGPERHPSAIAANLTAPFAWEGSLPTLFDFNKVALNTHDVPDGTDEVHSDVAKFMAAFCDLLRPEPNPNLAPNDDAQNPNAPQRGLVVFANAGCMNCHSGAAFTDRAVHDVGTGRKLDTPALQQLWDKAPYLHDGRAATLAEVFNPAIYDRPDAHGNLSQLAAASKEDLMAYLLSIRDGDIPTRIDEADGQPPRAFALAQNYPNPFNPETWIEYQLPSAGRVELAIYNGLGQKIRTLINQKHAPGHFQIKWDGRDEVGASAPSGIYFYQLRAGSFVQTHKALLVK